MDDGLGAIVDDLEAVTERLASGPVLPHPAVRVSINGSRRS